MFKKIKQFSSFADYNFMRRELGTSVKEQKKILDSLLTNAFNGLDSSELGAEILEKIQKALSE